MVRLFFSMISMYIRYLTGMFVKCNPSRTSGHSLTKSFVNCTQVLFLGGCRLGIRFLGCFLGWCLCLHSLWIIGEVLDGYALLLGYHLIQLVQQDPTVCGITVCDHD